MTKYTTEQMMWSMMLVCVFLGTLNLIDRYYYCIYMAVLFFIITPRRRLHLNTDFFVLMFLSIAMLLFSPGMQSSITSMIKPFTYPLCYLLGSSMLVCRANNNADFWQKEKMVSAVIYVLAGGAFAHFVLNMITNWGIANRDVIDVWTKSAMSATGQAALASLMVGISVAFLFSAVGSKKKIIAVVALSLVITYNLMLAGRTLFVLIMVTAVFALMCTWFAEKKKMIKKVIVLLGGVLVLIWLYDADAFGIRTVIESSNFYDRFFDGSYNQGINDDSRMEHKLGHLKYFFDYPWGGNNIGRLYGHHAHDLYLDLYDESGIFALLAIVVYIISSLSRMVKCIKSRYITGQTRMMISCVYFVCNVQFWLEPITAGMPWLLAAYCLFDGVVTYLLSQEMRNRRMAWQAIGIQNK